MNGKLPFAAARAYNNTVHGNIIENCNVGIGGNHWNNTFFENTIRANIGSLGWGISDDFYDCVFFHNDMIDNGQGALREKVALLTSQLRNFLFFYSLSNNIYNNYLFLVK